MKCKDCTACLPTVVSEWSYDKKDFVEKQVWQCTGVKEPFVIGGADDINRECTEYKEKRDKKVNDLSIDEVIQYWESLLKTFSGQLEREKNHFGRMHLQYTIDILNATIDVLKTSN